MGVSVAGSLNQGRALLEGRPDDRLSSTLAIWRGGGRWGGLVTALSGGMTMPTLPPPMLLLLAPFAPLFSRRVWRHAPVLVAGTILAPGRRTVAAALRATGLEQDQRFERCHRVLSR